MAYTKGQKVSVKKCDGYEKSNSKTATTKVDKGTYYIYAATVKNKKVQITKKKGNAGKEPASKYVLCWIPTSAINATTTKVETKTTGTNNVQSSANINSALDLNTNSAIMNNPGQLRQSETIKDVAPMDEATTSGGTKYTVGTFKDIQLSPEQVGYIGDQIFVASQAKILTINGFTMTDSVNIQVHDRHMKAPKLEFTGKKPTEIQFSIDVNKYLGYDPIKRYNKLKKYMEKGTQLPFRIGDNLYGNYAWVITGLSLKGDRTDAKGNWTTGTITVTMISCEKE